MRVTKGNETTVTFGGQVYLKAAFSLGPSSRPKTIDYILAGGPNQGETQYGIYELDGDTATFYFGAPGTPRPRDFTAKAGDGRTLTAWKRQKR